ncbi:MAG: asparaginase [Planctomycetes bacterium]|nr:asparaginase [Planctomycetota bacterium]
MPEFPKLRLIFTGGTISMRDDAGKGAVPKLTGLDILRDVPGLDKFCRPDVYDFGQMPGPHVTPARMLDLARLVARSFADGCDGAVITHGTDTLEETAYLLELLSQSNKPVVLVGAMRTSSMLSWDGPINLYQACQVAADQRSVGRGVMVVMNQTINAAAEVTKTYTEALDTYQSPDTGPMGIIDGGQVIFFRPPVQQRRIKTEKLEMNVGLVLAAAGMDGGLINYLVGRGDKAIVIEALGRGNLPPVMAKAAADAVKAGVIVVLTSRCLGGRVSPTYGYEGGGARLKDAGMLFAPGLPGHKVRLMLMAALGAGMSKEEVGQWLAP